ncbi:helix-turn-helix transcriptional regulator [Bifidobacterium adolescentis]|jgi:AraC-like DNA-binding protein|nr:helix-turn-helix transcriptional regulator [Bifidobacterium adolescentis]DAI98975.1 MAG TPA: helix-turn-helix domain protein [Caudoviricetes sp.]
MAKTPRAWTEMDRASMQIIRELRDEDPRHMSLRTMEKETGISRSRLDDLFHERMGSPSLQEFVTLCMLFHQRASACLEEAMKNTGQSHGEIIEAARAYEARERESQITDDLVEPRFEDLPPQELAASRDMNRNLEAETPDE